MRQELGHHLLLVSPDSEHHQHHRRERRPQRQNDLVPAGGLDHRLPRCHQRHRLLREGSAERGQNRRRFRTALISRLIPVLCVSSFPFCQVMYFSSLFPYVVLLCFLVRGLMLRGSVDGIAHMFTPKVRLTGAFCSKVLLGRTCISRRGGQTFFYWCGHNGF